MKKAILFNFLVDKEQKQIRVERSFDAPLDLVWSAWTEPEILDQWWAPKPYRTETKSMDFREGGGWLYSMVSPEGERHWCMADYKTIKHQKQYSATDAFCDEHGNINQDFPRMFWTNSFNEVAESTVVNIVIQYTELADLEKIIELGFKEGFTMAMDNLDQYIEAKFKLRHENKTSNKARVTSYLNFDGKTEEAFLFYKQIFKSDFIGKGIQRFGDLPEDESHPKVADSVKKMVLHVELPITGGHVLMGTDAPKEMGFTIAKGNNMHLCIEPESREEADKLFNELSSGGNVTMPMADMFFGAYFGEFSDKYGINWMINYTNKN